MKRHRRHRALSLAAAVGVLVSLASVTSAPARADQYQHWHLKNYTASPVWGHFELQNDDQVNTLTIKYERQLQPGATSSAGGLPHNPQYYVYMRGTFCYLGSWWDLPNSHHLPLNQDPAPMTDADIVSEPGVLFLNISRHGDKLNRANMNTSDAVPGDGCKT